MTAYLWQITAYNMHVQAYLSHISCISFAYLTNIVYIFAYFMHFFTYNWIFFAYLCIFLPDPFQLAGLRAAPVPFQQALQQQVRVHSSLLARSWGFARVWRPRGAARASPPPGPPRRPARSAAAAAPSTFASVAFLVLLRRDKVTILAHNLAEYTYICSICNTC